MGGFFDFFFGTETPEDEPQEDDNELPEAPELLPVEIEGLQDLIDRMNENQTLGEEQGIQFESRHDDTDEEI